MCERLAPFLINPNLSGLNIILAALILLHPSTIFLLSTLGYFTTPSPYKVSGQFINQRKPLETRTANAESINFGAENIVIKSSSKHPKSHNNSIN